MINNNNLKIKYFINIFLCFFWYINRKKYFLWFFTNSNKGKPKISIFLPIYNKEIYVEKCISRLLNQTLKDFEIIAVNDFSNDNTLSILNDLSKKDNRIKIINNDKNHGLLYSRAMGILNSSGEYIMNLDADDEINGDDCLDYLYNQTQIFKVDIITFNIFDKKSNLTIKCKSKNEILFQPKLFKSIFYENNIIREFLIWNKLIKKEIFIKALDDFQTEIYNLKWNYFEDDIWSILVNKYAKSKLCLDRLVYIYNYNNDSLMNQRIGAIEFRNILYRHEMYKKIFIKKEDEPYLIAEYYFLLNRLKSELKYLLLIKDNKIKNHIKNIFEYFINNYNCSLENKKEINNFLKLMSV